MFAPTIPSAWGAVFLKEMLWPFWVRLVSVLQDWPAQDRLFSTFTRVHAQSLSHVRLFETPCTVACEAPPFMRFPRQEY